MAKIYGLFGAMTGKLGDTVMSVRNGEQLARKYQPVVFNPSTPAQIAQRAKLKLLSQLSAVMAPVIAIPRKGSVSSRNIFTKINYPNVNYSENTASAVLNNIQLTSSVVAFPAPRYVRETETGRAYLAVAVTSGDQGVDRVVYAIFAKQADEKLRFVTSVVVTEAGANGSYPIGDLPLINEEVVIYAYGIRDNSEAAKVRLGNLEAPTAQTVAELIVTSTLTEADVTLTETTGYTLTAAEGSRGGDGEDEKKTSKKKQFSDNLS